MEESVTLHQRRREFHPLKGINAASNHTFKTSSSDQVLRTFLARRLSWLLASSTTRL